MVSTNERWAKARPVRDSLPGINGCYQSEVVDWLTTFPDALLTSAKFQTVEDGLRQVDPKTCDEKWLDLLAPLCGWQGYWDRSWPVAAKRILLAASYNFVWPNRGSAAVLSFVLKTLGITHVIQEGSSFIIGRSLVGDAIGSAAWEYDILLPSSLFNSREEKLARRINGLFGPCWAKSRILFDDSYFTEPGFFVLGDNVLLSVADPQTVLGL